jgi:hypothetical protein
MRINKVLHLRLLEAMFDDSIQPNICRLQLARA